MPAIPRAIGDKQIRQLLASFNRRTATGRRDYAIVLLLARLGLRANEVARLELEDLNWEAASVLDTLIYLRSLTLNASAIRSSSITRSRSRCPEQTVPSGNSRDDETLR
jgi:integrase